ncbi:MAG: hypothetical protein KF891_12645 [Rhizobacter sp.]|nr:hypothetical protein [Rhizobacter sp.]
MTQIPTERGQFGTRRDQCSDGLDAVAGGHGRGLTRKQVSDEVAWKLTCKAGCGQYGGSFVAWYAQREPHTGQAGRFKPTRSGLAGRLSRALQSLRKRRPHPTRGRRTGQPRSLNQRGFQTMQIDAQSIT